MTIKNFPSFLLRKNQRSQIDGTPEIHPTSLTQKTLINMTLRVAGVMLISVGVSYLHVMSKLEAQTKSNLERYIVERGHRESINFKLAQDNLAFLKQQLLEKLAQPSKTDFSVEFDRLLFSWPDGTIRNAPYNQPIEAFDAAEYSTVFVGRNVKLTSELKRRLITVYQLINAYGPAWTVRFPDTFFSGPENTSVIYWKNLPICLKGPGDYDVTKQEYFYVSDLKHNPERKLAWTGVYLDPVIKLWMVSAIQPIDDASGRFLGSVGHDVVLDNLMQQTINDRIPGTYNFVVQPDGRLIAHPHLMDKIVQSDGKLTIDEAKNSHLQRIFQQIKQTSSQTKVIDNWQNPEFLAFTQLDATGWYFVTVYPKSLLTNEAFDTVKFFLIAGIIALLIETLLLFLVLRKQITAPLRHLISATQLLAIGDFRIQLDTSRKDELGQLATSFTSMATQLDNSFQELAKINMDLENRVSDRTTELQTALTNLKHAQAQMVQTEKMSALGQMVAGVAHEINNPNNFIHGNLHHLECYTQGLLALVDAYESELIQPSPTLQENLENLDLEFVREDLPQVIASMRSGTERIRGIVQSLRNFSRLDESDLKAVNLHEGIDSTLMMLESRLKATDKRAEIVVIKDYATNLPAVKCYAGEINQVFLNIMGNGIDAFESRTEDGKKNPNTIRIRTEKINEEWVNIYIVDNGMGISEDVRSRVFDPFFTTKPVGKGTGLGLSISYQIVTEKHGGKIWCDSTLGEGTKFVIQLPVSGVCVTT